ncbi:uncharacterized protein LOC144878614 [Branchiostoma floridae x Branchiostoma japonicum]
MASKRTALDTEPDTVDEAPTKPKPKRKKPSPPKTPKCGCRGDCRTRKCACGKKGEACGDSCKCTDCVNPFNILAEYNIDLSDVALDKCLMDNIYKVEDLRGRLEQSYELECCDESVQLKDMLPGVAHCPGEECGYEWHYSWCGDSFEDEENDPKYHCEKCRRCADCRWEHCERCNKCYFATHNFNPCPTCGKYDDDDEEDSDYEERERCAMM